ncbi:MAG: hypothetical protein H3C34_01475 [Caldilineaceae bacterium]|nr:hypothetical protein [Caldilineaceae bacterium]
MGPIRHYRRNWRERLGISLVIVGLLGLLGVYAPALQVAAATPPAAASEALPSRAQSTTPADEPPVLKLLKTKPEIGIVGDPFTITATDLPPNQEIEFVWVTVDGFYVTQVMPENVEFHEKTFVETRMSLGHTITDAQGRTTLRATVPEDYGEIHDIFAVIDEQDVAKGGFRILRNITIDPESGPVGTPITIKATGLGWRTYESTLAVRYNNQYTGIMTAVTTRGTAVAQIRATGPVGKHVIDVNHGAKSVPYLNNQQSGTAHIPDFRFWFNVTEDAGPPPVVFDWPDESRIASLTDIVTRTTSSGILAAPDISATVKPASGPILSTPIVQVSGLIPNSEVELFWVTARGNRVGPRGWHLEESLLLAAMTDNDGSLSESIEIPDDLGGWHTMKLAQNNEIVAEIPYFVEHSLVAVTPPRVRAGEIFTVQIKGVGWTELDNGVAVTYDNDFIGFACGFNSNGDVTMNLVATGSPGTHLIDLYPMIYQGHGKPPWGYQVPVLTFKEDFPGLALGYNLPAIRLAIEVVE